MIAILIEIKSDLLLFAISYKYVIQPYKENRQFGSRIDISLKIPNYIICRHWLKKILILRNKVSHQFFLFDPGWSTVPHMQIKINNVNAPIALLPPFTNNNFEDLLYYKSPSPFVNRFDSELFSIGLWAPTIQSNQVQTHRNGQNIC